MSQKDIGNKIPIYKLKAGKEVEDYYDEWTVENKYDKDKIGRAHVRTPVTS